MGLTVVRSSHLDSLIIADRGAKCPLLLNFTSPRPLTTKSIQRSPLYSIHVSPILPRTVLISLSLICLINLCLFLACPRPFSPVFSLPSSTALASPPPSHPSTPSPT